MEGQTCFMDHVPPSVLIWVNSSQYSFFSAADRKLTETKNSTGRAL